MKELPTRKNIRLEGYNYSAAGAYFVTICIKDRHELLGEIVGADTIRPRVALSDIGILVGNAIDKISEIYTGVHVNCSIIMPNHVHMIVVIDQNSGRMISAPTLSRIIGYFKQSVSRKCGYSIWQKSFHDHIIRDESEYQKIWQYIDQNPANWETDRYFIN